VLPSACRVGLGGYAFLAWAAGGRSEDPQRRNPAALGVRVASFGCGCDVFPGCGLPMAYRVVNLRVEAVIRQASSARSRDAIR